MSEIQSVDKQLGIKCPTSIVISRSVFASRAINFCIEDNLSRFIILPLTFLNNSLLRICYRTSKNVFRHQHPVGT